MCPDLYPETLAPCCVGAWYGCRPGPRMALCRVPPAHDLQMHTYPRPWGAANDTHEINLEGLFLVKTLRGCCTYSYAAGSMLPFKQGAENAHYYTHGSYSTDSSRDWDLFPPHDDAPKSSSLAESCSMLVTHLLLTYAPSVPLAPPSA